MGLIDNLYEKRNFDFREIGMCVLDEKLDHHTYIEGTTLDAKDSSVKIIDISLGTPGSVEFNFLRILDHMQSTGYSPKTENRYSYTFIHCHPPGFGTSMSHMDVLCASGLLKGFGFPELKFWIVCFNDNWMHNIEGNISMYRWALDDTRLKPLHSIRHENVAISSNKFNSEFLSALRAMKALSVL